MTSQVPEEAIALVRSLSGATCVAAHVAPYSVHLAFDGGRSLNVTAGWRATCEHLEVVSDGPTNEPVEEGEPALTLFLKWAFEAEKVSDARIAEDGTIHLDFAGSVFQTVDNVAGYEAWDLHLGEKLAVIAMDQRLTVWRGNPVSS